MNKNYINIEVFSKSLEHRIAQACATREDSDYDDKFVVNPDVTKKQMQTVEELIKVVEEYINNFNNLNN